jgi:hypothetical protein
MLFFIKKKMGVAGADPNKRGSSFKGGRAVLFIDRASR